MPVSLPELNYAEWKDTLETLHRWSQIVGKIRFSKSPRLNHSWQATLYVSERGLTTGVIHEPHWHRDDPLLSFALEFDFVAHCLRITRSDGGAQILPLMAESVASFHDRCFEKLSEMKIPIRIFEHPNELMDAISFPVDHSHRSYDPLAAHRFWQALLAADAWMKGFRAKFLGKASPVHFFWGSFDLAASRFSGRRAPEHPGGIPHLPDLVTREAYSHEESSSGFWPGNELFPHAAFYSYAYPAPLGFERAKVPEGAFYHEGLKEFILPYDVVRAASDPRGRVLDFFESTYVAAADLGHWDRDLLERSPYIEALREGSSKKSEAA